MTTEQPTICVMPTLVDCDEPLELAISRYDGAAQLNTHRQNAQSAPIPPRVLTLPELDDPLQAVVSTMLTLKPMQSLLLLAPVDWPGPAPEYLLEQGQRWRATWHMPEEGEFYPLDAHHT